MRKALARCRPRSWLRQSLAASLGLLLASASAAMEIVVTTAESEVPPREARWTAEPVVASSAGEIDNASRSGVLTVPGRGLFDLDPTIGWNLTLEAEGAWSPGASTQPGQETAKLLLFPTVEIHGDLHREESDAPPERLEARFRSIEKNGGSPKLEGATPCLLDPGASA